MTKPNILLIITDQQFVGAMSGDRLEMEYLANNPLYRENLITHRELLRNWLHKNGDDFRIPEKSLASENKNSH